MQRVVDIAGTANVPVSVCGDAAADAAVLPLLLGAGVRTVSVAPSRLASVRTQVAGLSTTDAAAQLSTLLHTNAAADAHAVHAVAGSVS